MLVVRLSFFWVVFSFFSSLLGLIFEPFKKHFAWKMLQRIHGLLHLFILLRFSPVFVSVFYVFFFDACSFFPWSLRLPYWAGIFVFPFPFGLIFETFKNGRGRRLLQRAHDLITSCFSRRFFGGTRFRLSCKTYGVLDVCVFVYLRCAFVFWFLVS